MWRRKFHPGIAAPDQINHYIKAGLPHTFGCGNAAEMVDHQRHRQSRDHFGQRHDHRQVGVGLHMPAELCHARGGGFEQALRDLRIGLARRFQIHTHAAHAARVHRFEFGIADSGRVDHHHRTGAVSAFGIDLHHRIERAAIVSAIRTRMDDHHAWQLQRALQRQQLADGGVARQIGAARPIREAARRAEHVHMAIAGMERHGEVYGAVLNLNNFHRHSEEPLTPTISET